MRLGPIANVEAFTKLANETGEDQARAGVRAMTWPPSSAESATLQPRPSTRPRPYRPAAATR